MQNVVVEPGKIAGRKIRLGTDDFIVPPLSLRGLRTNQSLIDAVQTGVLVTTPDPSKPEETVTKALNVIERVEAIATISLCAIQRNYPTIKIDFMEDALDVGNMEEVFEAVLAQSGLVKRPPGETTAIDPSTGQPSSVASQQGSA